MEPKIIMPEEKPLTPEEKERELSNAFRMNDEHAVIPLAHDMPPVILGDEDTALLHPAHAVPVAQVSLGKAARKNEHLVSLSSVEGSGDNVAPFVRGK